MEETLKMMRRRLAPLYGQAESRAIIEIIFKYLMGWNRVDLLMRDDKELSPTIRTRIGEILGRLERHEPIQYITGIAPFYGMDLHVDRNVLIPRHETEGLVDMIADHYRDRRDLRVLDIATGSGCIAIALARNLPFADVTGLDISEGALAVARRNGKELKTAVRWEHADIFTYNPEPESLDIVVSNPPYVRESERAGMEANVLDYEPQGAIFVPDSDPLIFYSRIAEVAMEGLVPGGGLFLEINPLEAENLRKLLVQHGFVRVEIVDYMDARSRLAAAYKPGKDGE